MKKFKFIYLLAAVVGALSFASCQHPYADWTPGAQDANMGVYFPSTAGFEVAATDSSVQIKVARSEADAAASVSLRYDAYTAPGVATDLFTVPSKVDFAAGSKEAGLTIEFDGSQLLIGEKYSIHIKLDEAEASSYATSEATFTIMIPEPWTSMGTGIYFDDILCELFEEADSFRGLGAYVEFEQNDLDANRIRVKNPFSFDVLGSMWGLVPSWLQYTASEDVYVEFDITDPANVLVGEAFDLNGEAAHIFDFNLLMPDQGYELACIVKDSTPVVLEDGVIKFPVGAVILGAFSGGEFLGWFTNTGNVSGSMQYYLPGTEFVNYGMAVTYDGMYVSADGATAKAIFNFALGADVASYKFAFAQGDVTEDPSAIAEAIVAGDEELKIFTGTADDKEWQVELTKGVWTLVAVPYTEEGEARLQDTYAYNFYFNGTGEMPEVEMNVTVGAPASFVAEENKAAVEAETPACYWIGINIAADASQLKSLRAWWGTTASYESALAQGLTDDAILAGYAADLTEKILPEVAENGAATARVNVNNGYEYTVLFQAETIYGTKIVKTFKYTTPEYDGALAVGQYQFSDGEGDAASSFKFSLIPGKGYDKFYFVHDDIDGSTWYVTYDETAGTLTNEGVELGYEEYESQWGMLYGAFNKEATQVYSYFSSTTADYKEMAPMVMTVENNALAGLNTYFAMAVIEYDPVNNVAGGLLGMYFNFTPSTVIEPAVAAQSANAKFAAKAATMEACELHSVIASEAKVVINATPIARSFAMANLSL